MWFRNCMSTALIINASSTASTPVRIVNCIFSGNGGTYGGALQVSAVHMCGTLVRIVNCIFSGNGGTYGGALQVSAVYTCAVHGWAQYIFVSYL